VVRAPAVSLSLARSLSLSLARSLSLSLSRSLGAQTCAPSLTAPRCVRRSNGVASPTRTLGHAIGHNLFHNLVHTPCAQLRRQRRGRLAAHCAALPPPRLPPEPARTHHQPTLAHTTLQARHHTRVHHHQPTLAHTTRSTPHGKEACSHPTDPAHMPRSQHRCRSGFTPSFTGAHHRAVWRGRGGRAACAGSAASRGEGPVCQRRRGQRVRGHGPHIALCTPRQSHSHSARTLHAMACFLPTVACAWSVGQVRGVGPQRCLPADEGGGGGVAQATLREGADRGHTYAFSRRFEPTSLYSDARRTTGAARCAPSSKC
jgi:hypothetical protein